MREHYKYVLVGLLLALVTCTLIALGMDALEYEVTGVCEYCNLLPLLRSGIE